MADTPHRSPSALGTPLSQERWQQLKQGEDRYWLAIGRDALRLDAP